MYRWSCFRRLGLAGRLAVVAGALATPVTADGRTGVKMNDAACGESGRSTLCCPEPGHLCIALPLPVEDYKYEVLPYPGCIG